MQGAEIEGIAGPEHTRGHPSEGKGAGGVSPLEDRAPGDTGAWRKKRPAAPPPVPGVSVADVEDYVLDARLSGHR